MVHQVIFIFKTVALSSCTLSIVMLGLSETIMKLAIWNNLQHCCHIFVKNFDTLKSLSLQGAVECWKARSHWEPNAVNTGIVCCIPTLRVFCCKLLDSVQ